MLSLSFSDSPLSLPFYLPPCSRPFPLTAQFLQMKLRTTNALQPLDVIANILTDRRCDHYAQPLNATTGTPKMHYSLGQFRKTYDLKPGSRQLTIVPYS